MTTWTDHDDGRVLDHVLGWTGRWARRSMNQRIASNPELEARVCAWETTLLPLTQLATPLAPPAGTWDAVLAKLNTHSASVLRRRMRWAHPGAACTALLAMILLAPPAPVYRAVLSDAATSAPIATLSIDRYGRLTVADAAAMPVGDDKSLELWLIPEGGAPHALGLMPADHHASLKLDGVTSPATLAVSIEPKGGSPTGGPTGPVIASGPLQPV